MSRRALSWLRRTAIPALAILTTACTAEREPQQITVVGMDYAFQAPESVSVGPAVIRFESRGKVRHEMVFAQIRDDVPNALFADSLMRGGAVRALRATGSAVLFAAPGEKNDGVRLRVVFERGHRYALWCQFRDSDTAPKHQALGMFKLVAVR